MIILTFLSIKLEKVYENVKQNKNGLLSFEILIQLAVKALF